MEANPTVVAYLAAVAAVLVGLQGCSKELREWGGLLARAWRAWKGRKRRRRPAGKPGARAYPGSKPKGQDRS